MIQLPDGFREKMKGLLEEEYDSFMESYHKERVQGLRINPLKISRENFMEICPFQLKKIPWAEEGYYYPADERPGKHPYHEAGLYYIQEPSAMAVVELLDPRPGERILDLCAAPGGKTTHIAGRLKGNGFLLSNEIHPARARILSQNVERLGIGNCVVSNEDSQSLSRRFPSFFDRIVVDAPCSGEGMFRKDETARQEWTPGHVTVCAARQEEILSNAAVMLKPGGTMVYSTCTFSPEENEQVIEAFLFSHPDFSIKDEGKRPGLSPGRPEWSRTGLGDLKKTFRIWPDRSEGEGHFLAVLKKSGEHMSEKKKTMPEYTRDKTVLTELAGFLKDFLVDPAPLMSRKEFILFGDQLYLLPPEMIDFKGMKIIRPGLHIGTVKKNRFEPSHGFALSLKKEEVKCWIDLPPDGEEIVRYLKGETLPQDAAFSRDNKKGWILVNTGGYSIGFSKLAGGILKNHYPKGLRWM
ncbi:RsmB/NOP family class I SAM-dependent RNA methyltransferase [Lacrimispora saccharolytica]|uniref:RNA methylase, NOL1/NOP2/sun family n=1 Tax=Lacrimispora saccharolytica (strain ATCC 35040 / DSM 2544 / NRCC 2533 / WM1) TaxID=610130 RepID=D9R8U4_LACSW|nr:RsmF rRNA methyltransferase first C-terminal domain-containing protein [Lacrimispora saccharolytica]ADL03919.1 RNA methylase, NOL1/NOP2/sun family [[Clostridium] saccharolyticum WM1]QRV21771.1 RsmB/NOP family class I SAM-dependent RNA methyltransferase [Lacrimispora saccharolytica]